MEPGQLLQADIFRLLAAVTIGAAVLFAFSRLVQGFFKHRRPVHSPTFWVGITIGIPILLALIVPEWWWMGLTFSWGWFTHLATDGLTPRGIPLFWPLSNVKGSLIPGFLQSPARFLVVIVSALSVVLLVMRLIGLI